MTDQHNNVQFRCPYCAMPAALVWVHGHGQCAHCHINIDECCRGESCQSADITLLRPEES